MPPPTFDICTLPEGDLTGQEYFAICQGGQNKKLSLAALFQYIFGIGSVDFSGGGVTVSGGDLHVPGGSIEASGGAINLSGGAVNLMSYDPVVFGDPTSVGALRIFPDGDNIVLQKLEANIQPGVLTWVTKHTFPMA